MRVVTGAAGFIGSCMVGKLNREGVNDIIIVDDFTKEDRRANWENKQYIEKIDREDFLTWFSENANKINEFYHLGARSATTELSWTVLERLNLNYTKQIWKICSENDIPLIYASSAATYGAGEQEYDDDLTIIPKLQPLNLYGKSKQEFDLWQLKQEKRPPFWAGLKFFNVYGPNEYHKQRMASVILHAFNQINNSGKVCLFKSYKEGYEDGWQLRDFVYVKDLVDVMYFFMVNKPKSDIYNIGTGHARSFWDLAKNTFVAMNRNVNIEFISMPEDIRDKYQYFTEAKINKLRHVGYSEKFYSLEEGVKDYVQNYLINHLYY
ncbi:MAG: ADP-glyceromanno-heptose 6-epimerase [Bacteroidales bacterium]|nr:ADP-glyceromanno-heptose 6-epimerase [Bacteroidales bacterium]